METIDEKQSKLSRKGLAALQHASTASVRREAQRLPNLAITPHRHCAFKFPNLLFSTESVPMRRSSFNGQNQLREARLAKPRWRTTHNNPAKAHRAGAHRLDWMSADRPSRIFSVRILLDRTHLRWSRFHCAASCLFVSIAHYPVLLEIFQCGKIFGEANLGGTLNLQALPPKPD
jgi:hypothetical protein